MASILKRGPGQWQAKVRRKGYPPQTRFFETKREAESWAAVIESEMARSVFVDRSLAERETLGDVIRHYVADELPDHKGAGVELARLQRFLRDETDLCIRPMAALRTEDFEAYRDRRLNEHGRSPGTVKRELGLIRAIVEYSRRRLGLLENPVADVKRPRVRDNRDVRLQPGDEERLLAALDECRTPWPKAAVILALETAMRRGEILSIKWPDVDLEARVVHLADTKTGEARDVPLSSRALETIRALPKVADGSIIATTIEGLKNAFERARTRAGLEHFNFHDLRHEATSRLFERGWNMMEVAAVTGHKDLQSLKRYTNLRASDLAKKMG